MRFLGYLLGAALVLLGLLFLVASARGNTVPRLIVGGVILAGGLGLILALIFKPAQHRVDVTYQVDLTGDVNIESLKCRQCGAPLDGTSAQMREGAIFVKCPYCDSFYQLEEEAKW